MPRMGTITSIVNVATIVNMVLSAVAVLIAGRILPGVKIKSFGTAVIVSFMLSLIMPGIAQILTYLTIPLNAITLSVLNFLCTGFMIIMVATLVPGFNVDSFAWACLFAFALSALNFIIYSLL